MASRGAVVEVLTEEDISRAGAVDGDVDAQLEGLRSAVQRWDRRLDGCARARAGDAAHVHLLVHRRVLLGPIDDRVAVGGDRDARLVETRAAAGVAVDDVEVQARFGCVRHRGPCTGAQPVRAQVDVVRAAGGVGDAVGVRVDVDALEITGGRVVDHDIGERLAGRGRDRAPRGVWRGVAVDERHDELAAVRRGDPRVRRRRVGHARVGVDALGRPERSVRVAGHEHVVLAVVGLDVDDAAGPVGRDVDIAERLDGSARPVDRVARQYGRIGGGRREQRARGRN